VEIIPKVVATMWEKELGITMILNFERKKNLRDELNHQFEGIDLGSLLPLPHLLG